MYILWKNGLVSLQEPDQFKAFKLVIDAAPGSWPEVAADFEGIATVDDASAWVAQRAVRNMSGREDDATWRQAFDAMLDKARPHGWIDDATGDIKAHVEWRGPSTSI